MKKILIALISIIIILCTFNIVITKKINNYYPMTAIITEVNEKENLVTIEDFNGNLWEFEGVEDWAVNDICSCLMDNNNTVNIKDDKIIKTTCSGYLKNPIH